jgi:hypothetical protein
MNRLRELEETSFLTRSGADGAATVFDCPLCACKFTHGELTCVSCPLGAGCGIVKCPNCGYQFPRGSRLVAWWSRVFGKR